jgi:hypothetical protein
MVTGSTPKDIPAVQSSTNGRHSGGIVRPLMTPRITSDAESPGSDGLMVFLELTTYVLCVVIRQPKSSLTENI